MRWTTLSTQTPADAPPSNGTGSAPRTIPNVSIATWLAPLTLGVFLLALALSRGFLLLTDGAASMDLATYIANVLWLEGRDVGGTGHVRPPGMALLLWPWVRAFGPVMGGEIVGVLFSVAWPVPFYLFTRRFLAQGPALLVALLAATSYAVAQPLMWGWLVLAGMTLACTGWVLASLHVERPRWQTGLGLAATMGALMLLDGVGFVVFLLVSTPVFLFALSWRAKRDLAPWLALGLALAAPWVWWQFGRFGGETNEGTRIWLWYVNEAALPALAVPVLAFVLLRRAPGVLRWWTVGLITLGFIGVPFATPSVAVGTVLYRAGIYMPLAIVAGAGWMVARHAARSWWLGVGYAALAALVLIWNTTTTTTLLQDGLAQPPVYAEDHEAAIRWLVAHTDPEEPVAVSTMAFGWWLEAGGERMTPRRAWETIGLRGGGVQAQESAVVWALTAGDTVLRNDALMVGTWPTGASVWLFRDGNALPVAHFEGGTPEVTLDGGTVTVAGADLAFLDDAVNTWIQEYPVDWRVQTSGGVITLTCGSCEATTPTDRVEPLDTLEAAGVRYFAVDSTPRVTQHGPPPPWFGARAAQWPKVWQQGDVAIYQLTEAR